MDDLSASRIDGTVTAVITIVVAYDIAELDIAPGYAYTTVVADGIGAVRYVDVDLSIAVLNET
jgi:hypothetical protein